MKKYQFGICGAFDFKGNKTGGQSVKTREFYDALCLKIGKANIGILETTEYKKNPIIFFCKVIKLMNDCRYMIIFPAQNGIKVFAPLCYILKRIYNTKIYYNVIGGWLAKLIDSRPIIKFFLRDFDKILVETNIMKEELKERKILNVVKLKNFKELKPIEKSKIKKVEDPVRICYFSRVTKKKGIEDAVNVVNKINSIKRKCILDIFGPIVDEYSSNFKLLMSSFDENINYRGEIASCNSVYTISNYDIQLFPTHYKTEGIPGAIIDSFFAGVPVVAAKWNSFDDLIIDGQTGIGYDMNNIDDMFYKLDTLISNKNQIMHMKQEALKESQYYKPEKVIEEFLEIIKD